MSRKVSTTITAVSLVLMAFLVLGSLTLALAQDTNGAEQPPAAEADQPLRAQENPPSQETEEPEPVETEEPPPVETEPPSPVPPPSIQRFEPREITNGEARTMSVFGQNFESGAVVRLDGFGVLETQNINGVLVATIPANIPRGEYRVQVINQSQSSQSELTSDRLRVNNPPAPPATEQPTEPPPTPTTAPTPIPGQPSLLIRGFTASPASIPPGGTTTLTLEIVNQGNRPALGVSVAVDASGQFVPANGQAGATVPDLAPGGVFGLTLTVVASQEATPGPASIPLTFTYRDFEGESYTATANAGVTIIPVSEASQVTIARYLTDPNPVVPGEAAAVEVLVTNTGNKVASQVLLRVAGESSVLLAGPQGDSFPIGDLAPGASTSVTLPLMVRRDAEAGPAAQPITITYLQDGESVEAASSITVDVARMVQPEPVMLLESYDVGVDLLQPGDQFTLNMTLQNVGDADALNMLVTFGTVESTGGSGNGGDPPDGDGGSGSTGSSGGGTTSTTPSTTFAPLGAGGTAFVGTVSALGGQTTLSQAFIVNGTVDSGIYSLPITLRYETPEGESVQDNLRASVVVLAPPRLRASLETPLPETVNIGEPFPVAVALSNTGSTSIDLTEAAVTTNNGEMLEGAEVMLDALDADDDTTITGLVMPQEPGPVEVTVTISYTNDLNQPDTLVLTYETEAVEPPPPPENMGPPPDVTPPPPPEPSREDTIGRLLLGLLGLGS